MKDGGKNRFRGSQASESGSNFHRESATAEHNLGQQSKKSKVESSEREEDFNDLDNTTIHLELEQGTSQKGKL